MKATYYYYFIYYYKGMPGYFVFFYFLVLDNLKSGKFILI